MELSTCALILLIVGFVTASPYRYETKGGTAAKADAHAIAGAYTNPGNIPVSIPSGAGYSGSFSQSASSSSSSASSSSFIYSGSGAIGGVPSDSGCGSGNCNGGGTKNSQGSGASALAGGYASKIPTSSYGQKYGSSESQANNAQNCGSEGCQGGNYSDSLIENGAGTSSQSTSDAKSTASAGAGYLTGTDCKGSDCNNLPTSNQDAEVSSSIDYGTNDIRVPTSGSSHPRPNYGASASGCSNGDCRLSSVPESQAAPDYNKPATDLTAPKLESACSDSKCQNSFSGYNSPSCTGGSCDYSTSSQTKAPYTSSNYQNVNQISQSPTLTYGGFSKLPSGSSGSEAGLSSVPAAFGVVPGTRPPPYIGNVAVAAGTSIQQDAKENLPAYKGGFGGPAGVLKPNEFNAPTSNYGNMLAAVKPASPSYGGLSKPSYSDESSPNSPVKPSGPGCAPGTPGCDIPASLSSLPNCGSGNCGTNPSAPGFGSPSTVKPSYSFESLSSYSPVSPSSSACISSTPGCTSSSSTSGPSDCTSGNCGAHPISTDYGSDTSIMPSYTHGSSYSFSPVKPSGLACATGTPGCHTTPSAHSPSDCTSGNCAYPSAPGYSGSSSIKPSYSQGSSLSYSQVNPSSVTCTPGTPGCVSYPPASYGGSLDIKPSYSIENTPSYSPVKPPVLVCATGTPGCDTAPSVHSPSDCTSENCAHPSAPGYSGSSSTRPSYSHGKSPSNSPVNPSSLACTPGTPGCVSSPSADVPSGCVSGNCGAYPKPAGYSGSVGIKPSYSNGNSPSYSPLKPSGPSCAPGIPGCAIAPSANGPSDCASGYCAYPSLPGYGGSLSIKPSYSQGSSYFQVKPSGLGCTSGTPGCGTLPSASSSSPPEGCTPGTLGCSGLPSTMHSGGTGFPHTVSSNFPSTQTTSGIHGSSYVASGAGSSLNRPSYVSHGTGSIQTSYNKPASTGFPTVSSGNGAYSPIPSASGVVPGIGSPSYTGNIGATSGVSTQQGTKEKLPAYTGGFGGPSGILKPNEFSAPTSNYGNKPALTPSPSTATPSCTSGICNVQVSPSYSHSESASAATAGASASANAVTYTGGFGGPPGFLKPYDNGKIDLKGPTGKQLQGSLIDSKHGGSGIHSSYSNGGSQISGSTVVEANAAAINTAGVNGGDKLHSGINGDYNHEHNGADGCGGGCGGNSSSNLGYSEALGLSKTGALDDTSKGLATASAVAKSVATASSGARAYGGSYASSSSSAGALIKGGYGRR